MDIKEAVNVLDQVTSVFKGTRQEHALIAQALQVIKIETNEKTEQNKTG